MHNLEPMRQPYARANFIPKSGTMNLATGIGCSTYWSIMSDSSHAFTMTTEGWQELENFVIALGSSVRRMIIPQKKEKLNRRPCTSIATSFPRWGLNQARNIPTLHREYWTICIYRAPGFLLVMWFGSSSTPIPLSRQVSSAGDILFRNTETREDGGGGGRLQENLVFYKSFNILCLFPSLSLLWAGIFKQSVGARNRIGIGLSYRPARLHWLAEFIPWNRFLGSIFV